MLFPASALFAQGDTLLYENFDVDPTANYQLFNNGNDTTWVNFDADGITDFNGFDQNWFYSTDGFASVDSGDGCLVSSSWLANYVPGNRNWLMTPPLQIVDANAVLSWASAPGQTPLYLDGYTVLVSTTDNQESSFTDTLFQAASHLDPPGTGGDYSTYLFSPGFIHGLDSTYIEFDGDSSRLNGILRPFSATLAPYSGQTIYIAFLHDSDDDFLLALDDIMVTGTLVGINEIADALGVNVHPNPSSEKIELSYLLPAAGAVSVKVYDIKGNMVMFDTRGTQLAGNQKLALDISKLSTGAYNVVLNAAGTTVTTKFVKD